MATELARQINFCCSEPQGSMVPGPAREPESNAARGFDGGLNDSKKMIGENLIGGLSYSNVFSGVVKQAQSKTPLADLNGS